MCQCRQGGTSPAPLSRLPLWGCRLVKSAFRDATADLSAPPSAPPSCTVPTWASMLLWASARFSIKNNAGCKEICLFCRFPDPTAASSSLARPPQTRRRQCRRNCGKPTTCTSSTQTELPAYMLPPRAHRTTSPESSRRRHNSNTTYLPFISPVHTTSETTLSTIAVTYTTSTTMVAT
jgi:hypothetical protein